MNEPLINPWIFWMIDVLHALNDLGEIVWTLSILVLGVLYALKKVTERDNYKTAFTVLTTVMIISALTFIVIPTKEGMYKMLIASQVTPHNLQVSQEVANDLLDNIEERAVKLIQEAKK